MADLRRIRVPSWKTRLNEEKIAPIPQKSGRRGPVKGSSPDSHAAAVPKNKIKINKSRISSNGQIRKTSGKTSIKNQLDLLSPPPTGRKLKVSNVAIADRKTGGISAGNKNDEVGKVTGSKEESVDDDNPKEIGACCHEVGDFVNPIFVYSCIKRPEYVAGHLRTWEGHRQIDGAIKNNGEPFHDDEGIPRDAIYILLAEFMIHSPFGSAMFFATKDENGAFCLKVGFYYSYHKISKCDDRIYSLREWCDMESKCGWPILQYEETIHPAYNSSRFQQVYPSMTKAVDAEMDERRCLGLRHLQGNRSRPFRTRAPVIDQQSKVAFV